MDRSGNSDQKQNIQKLTDSELKACLAKEMFGWEEVRITPDGRVWAHRPGVFSFAPLEIPEWTKRLDDANRLQRRIKQINLQVDYVTALRHLLGVDDGDVFQLIHATARQRCEAALAAVRHTAPR